MMHKVLTQAGREGERRDRGARGGGNGGGVVLPEAIEAYLRRFMWRRAWVGVWRGVLLAAVFSVVWMGGWLLTDRVFHLAWWARLGGLLVQGIVVVWLVGRPVWGALRGAIRVRRVKYGSSTGGMGIEGSWSHGLTSNVPRSTSNVQSGSGAPELNTGAWVDGHPMVEAAVEVERLDGGFGDRLATVVSQVVGPGRHRGSEAMLGVLTAEVAERARLADARGLLPWRVVFEPSDGVKRWLATVGIGSKARRRWAGAVLAGLLVGLIVLNVRWLDVPQLGRRYAMPLADVAPVTTTRVAVETEPGAVDGVVDVVQGQAVVIRAEATRPGGRFSAFPQSLPVREGDVLLHVKREGKDWGQFGMERVGEGLFEHALTGVEHDLHWYVSAGDARTRVGQVRVLRRPAVAEFRIHYEYPVYSERRSLTVSNADGLIEAPAGTEAVVTVISTEPLERAVMQVGRGPDRRRSLDFEPGEDPRVWSARVRVEEDSVYLVELVSDRGVPGSGPGEMEIRAIPDRPPLVRLLQPAEDVRLNPRDILQVHYQALDDYGIGSMWLTVRVNDSEGQQVVVPLRGDARRQEGTHEVDLAGLELQIGDVVTVSLSAEDRASHRTSSDPRTVLISPRSIDMVSHLRIAELRQSAELAKRLVKELESAARVIEEGEGSSGLGYLFRMSQVDRYVTGAAETAVLLRQGLLRAVVRSGSPEMSVALGRLVDEAQVQWSRSEQVVARLGRGGGIGGPVREQLSSQLEPARKLEVEIRTISESEQAAALLADRENVRASEEAHAEGAEQENEGRAGERPQSVSELLSETLRRAREEISATATAMGVAVDDEFEQNLRAKLEAGRAVVEGYEALDLESAAREWAMGVLEGEWDGVFEERLAAAAQVEAVRPEGDLIYARDLQLGARAAGALAGRWRRLRSEEERTDMEGVLEAFVDQVGILQRGAFARRAADPFDEFRAVPDRRLGAPRSGPAWDEEVSAARAQMVEWAGQTPGSSLDRLGVRRGVVEELVLEAGAESAGRGYERVEAIDEELQAEFERAQAEGDAGAERAAEAIRQARRLMAEARELDRLASEQGALSRQTEAPDSVESDLLADRQQEVATAILSIEEQRRPWDRPSAREVALAGIQQAQERLAAMPQQLAEARESARVRRFAAARLEMAEMEVETSVGDRYEVAQRAAREALRQLNEAHVELEAVLRPVHAEVAEALSRELRRFYPETSGAVSVLDQQLGPWLRRLRQAMRTGEGAEVETAIQETREALERVQAELRRAQDELVERDPLVAARWFAREATAALAHSPPNLQTAQAHQEVTSSALSRAWDQSVQRAARERLSGATGLRTLFSLPVLEEEGTEGAQAMLETIPALREWGRMRLRPPQARTAPRHEYDPPGYQEALRAYFEALGRE